MPEGCLCPLGKTPPEVSLHSLGGIPLKRLIRQAAIVLPDHVAVDCDMRIVDGVIEAIGSNLPVDNHFECSYFFGDMIIPGLIDAHVHGAGGGDIMDGTAESLTVMRQALLREGTTAFLGTTMSSSIEQLAVVLKNLASVRKKAIPFAQSELLGVHLEGPFLTAEYKGAHVERHIPPLTSSGDAAVLEQLARLYPDLIRILTFAVDRLDMRSLTAFCQRCGIIPSAGHTAVDYAGMSSAAAEGVHRITHAFNAMPGIHHRKPGPMTEGLLNPAIEMELIADGVHVHPAVLEMVFRLKPPDKVVLVSDGTRSVGMPDGEYELGGQTTTVKNGVARLRDGTIAGSACPLLQGIRTMVQGLKRSLPEAVRFASLNPARSLGVAHRLGSLEPGKAATFVRLSPHLTVKQVWVQGNLAVERN